MTSLGVSGRESSSQQNKVEEIIDARTSDAVALAIRFDSPIYTYSKILENAGIILKKVIDGENAENLLTDEYKTLTLKQLNKKISDAIENEDYEAASRFRDEINKRKEN